MSKTRSFLSGGISHFALIAALAVALPLTAHAADVDVTAPASDPANGIKTIANNQSGVFSGTADATSQLNYAGGGTLGDAGIVVDSATINGAGILNAATGSTFGGTIGASGHSLFTLNLQDTSGNYISSGSNYINTVNVGVNDLALNGATNVFNTLTLGNNATVSLASGSNLTASTVTGAGNLDFFVGSTFTYANLGTSGTSLGNITIGDGSTGGTTTFNASSAANIYTGTFFLNYPAVQFTGATTTLHSDLTSLSAGNGVIDVDNTSGSGVIITGNAGAVGSRLNTVSFINASNNFFTVGGNLYTATGFDIQNNTFTIGGASASTLDVGSGQSITTNSGGNGTMDFIGAGGVTVANNIGASGTHLGALNVNGTGTHTLNGTSNYINTTNFGANGGLTLGTGVNLTGNVTTSTNNTGTLSLGTNSSLTGAAGGTGLWLTQVNLGTNGSISSNVFATTTNLNGTDSSIGSDTGTTLNFNSAAGTVIGNVAVTAVNAGGSNGATANIGGTLSITSLAFANNSTLTATGASTITGNVTTAGGNGTGTLDINGNSNLAGNVGGINTRLAALNYGGGSTLNLGGTSYLTSFNVSGSGGTVAYGIGAGSNITNDFTGGANTYIFAANNTAASVEGVRSNNAVDFSTSATVLNTGAVTSAVGQRTRYVMGQNGNNTAIAAPASFSVSAPVTGVHFLELFDDSLGNGVNNQLDAVALQNNYYSGLDARTGRTNSSFADYLDAAVAGRATDVNGNSVYTYLNTLDSQIATGNNAAAQNTLQQGQPEAQSQENQATRTANEEFLGVVDDRMFKSHTGSGINSGDTISPGRSVWIEAFGGVGDQNSRDGYSGFNSSTGGVAAGADRQFGKSSLLGLAGSYAYSRVKSEDVDQTSDIDTYQGAVYGQTYFTGKWFLMGQGGGAFNHYQGSRAIPAAGVTAGSDYDGWGYFANAKTGYDVPLQDGFLLTPFASLTHIGNHLDSYTETGAGGMDSSVASSNPRTTTGRLGAQLAKSFVTEDRTILRPQIRVDYLRDFQRDDQATIASFGGTGVAGTFATHGIIQSRNGIDAGLGLDIMAVDNLTFSANYDYQWRDGYNGNSGVLKARYDF